MKPNIDDLRYAVMEAEQKWMRSIDVLVQFIYEECKKYNIPVDGALISFDKDYREEKEMELRTAYDLERAREKNDAVYHAMKEGEYANRN